MIQTFTALGVFVIALLPGAMYTWGFERFVGLWGIRLADRVMRFLGASAIFHALLLPLTYAFWSDHIRTGRLGDGIAPGWTWPAAIAYVFVPFLAGVAVGRGTLEGAGWATFFTGPDPAPRAWDYLFGFRPDGWLRLRLKSGVWVGGAYASAADGRRSYAAGYPEPQDLFLVQTTEVDPSSGAFLFNDDGSLRLGESSLLIRWDEVEFLEFIEA